MAHGMPGRTGQNAFLIMEFAESGFIQGTEPVTVRRLNMAEFPVKEWKMRLNPVTPLCFAVCESGQRQASGARLQ